MLLQNSAHKAERLEYMSRTQTLSWFFFELLLVGYVEDCNAGVCFHFPEDLDWTIYIEVCYNNYYYARMN